ncbi:IPExxxVDY family protein [Bizionia myxarmorum]|uniref:IPExxxVDY family protein n=1 Tax=Bizionia myxarmorum TaxID=291186 RepID=A0A5D0RD47_9FLAO|nr:IPExxxVDY family protein [Bizionia myxarmorum]TYB78638.1 IPExxxVDY family protein [Bizionia myxarmorum]
MSVQKLILNDFGCAIDYALIGIHCNLESYRLAYFLNRELQIHLSRQPEDLDYGNHKFYEIFEWEDIHNFSTWHFVSNSCSVELASNENANTLFSSQETVTTTFYLIPEYKKVNYFLKITDDAISDEQIQELLKKIQNIPNVIATYSIDPMELKSKNNLIFY